MNKIDFPLRQERERLAGLAPSAANEDSFDKILVEFVSIIRRQARVILLFVILSVIVAIAYVALRPAQYRAVVSVLVDPARVNLLQSQQIQSLPVIDSSFVDSQVEIIKSDAVALAVVRKLKLAEDSEFNQISAIRLLLSPVLRLLLGAQQPSAEESERNAADRFQRGLTVQRSGMSYVVELGFRALSPDKAALIANTTAEAYLEQQIAARLDAARRASHWLQERSDELKSRMVRSEEAVQAYKNQHNLVEVGGRLLIEQQLSDLSGQLPALQAQAAEAQIRSAQVRALIRSGDLSNGSVDVAPDSTIGKLRQQATDLSRREKELEQRFGGGHRLVLDARSELRSIRRQLEEEFARLDALLNLNAEIGLEKLRAAQERLDRLAAEVSAVRDKEIVLRELQREAQSNRQLFESFSNRHKETLQQESLPIVDARVLAYATRPTRPSNPRLALVLAGAAVAGLLIGVGAGLIRDRTDGRVRRVSDIEEDLGRPVFALLENVPSGQREAAGSYVAGDGKHLPVAVGLLRHVIRHPLSNFAESFRSLRVSLSLRSAADQPMVIGITSTEPGEGKSTVACNLAQHLTQTGARVLLIDGDMRNPMLSRVLRRSDVRGVPDVIEGRCHWRDLIATDPQTGMAFLAGHSQVEPDRTAETLVAPGFRSLLKELRAEYNLIVVDLAPITGTFDARAAAPSIDSFLFVVGWGQASRAMIERALRDAPEVYDKLSGVILNRIDSRVFGLFEYAARPASSYGYRYG